MTKRKIYFIKQKLIGIFGLILSVLTIHWLDGDVTAAVLLSIPSLAMIHSKKMLLVNNYYMDVMDKKHKRL